MDVVAPVTKRPRTLGGALLRPYEAVARWEAQLARLADYKRKHGDCNVWKG